MAGLAQAYSGSKPAMAAAAGAEPEPGPHRPSLEGPRPLCWARAAAWGHGAAACAVVLGAAEALRVLGSVSSPPGQEGH